MEKFITAASSQAGAFAYIDNNLGGGERLGQSLAGERGPMLESGYAASGS